MACDGSSLYGKAYLSVSAFSARVTDLSGAAVWRPELFGKGDEDGCEEA